MDRDRWQSLHEVGPALSASREEPGMREAAGNRAGRQGGAGRETSVRAREIVLAPLVDGAYLRLPVTRGLYTNHSSSIQYTIQSLNHREKLVQSRNDYVDYKQTLDLASTDGR